MSNWVRALAKRRTPRAVVWLVFLSILAISGAVQAGSPSEIEPLAALDCNTTAASVGLDLVLPIQAGAESFKTGYWVYQTSGSDHTGKDSCALDFFDVFGKRVVAVADGEVVVEKWQNVDDPRAGYGYYVVVLHKTDDKNYYSVYSHLQDPEGEGFPLECKVTRGKTVKAGECIGISGKTGKSIDDGHLHFGMWTGTDTFANTSPIAPEPMRGIQSYGTLAPQTSVTTMSTTEALDSIVPALTLQLNETQSRSYVFKNTSKITWDATNKFELVRVSGTPTGVPDRIPLMDAVGPNQNATFSIPISGTTPGLFESEWQLHHNNVAFGPRISLKYTVGVSADDLSNLPGSLWELIKPILLDYLKTLFMDLLRDILQSYFPFCFTVPASLTGFAFGMVLTRQKRQSPSEGKPRWPGRGNWLTVMGQLIIIVLILIGGSFLFVVGRELIWWAGVIKNTGLLLLGLAAALWVWGLVHVVKWIKDLGLTRLLIVALIIIVPSVYFHGQRYRMDDPFPMRYISSIRDFAWLALDKTLDFGKAGREFTNEFTLLTGIQLPQLKDFQSPVPTAEPGLDAPPIASTPGATDLNPAADETKSSCTLVWAEYPSTTLGGKNRSMVWDEIVKSQVEGSGMTASQFNALVVEQNPDLIQDGYEFKNGKKYKLPLCQ